MHDIAPILDVEFPAFPEDLPTPVASLRMQAALEEKTEAECFEQKVAFWVSEFKDIKELFKYAETRGLFAAEENPLREVKMDLDNILHFMRVHDSAVTPTGAVRSTRLRVVGGV